MQKLIAVALVVCSMPAALGSELKMGCENPRRPYLAVYDSEARTFVIDPDTDKVTYRVDHAGPLSADGDVGYQSGLTFRAYFGPNPRIRFYSGNKLVQTDKCQPTVLDLMN